MTVPMYIFPQPQFTKEQETRLKQITESPYLTISDYTSSEIRQLAAAYSFYSGKIEGNTYDYVDTESLLLDDITAPKKYEDAVMLKNLFNTFIEMHSRIRRHGPIEVNPELVKDIHSMLSDKLLPDEDRGRIRRVAIKVNGTNYIPSKKRQYLSDGLDHILLQAGKIKETNTRAIFTHLNIARLQPFRDVNKRTARMIESVILMNEGLCPVYSTSEIQVAMYRRDILHFYETKDFSQYINFFLNRREEIVRRLTPEEPDKKKGY